MPELRGCLHCRACTERGQTQRLEVGIDDSNLVVQCKKHGLVVALTPDTLAELLSHPPECECCANRRALS
ncbi:MAG TPA: hypothetical protein VGK73_03450 [Polyangiaceae bacterium]